MKMASNALVVEAISMRLANVDLELGDKILKVAGKKPTGEANGQDVHRMYEEVPAGGTLELIVERP